MRHVQRSPQAFTLVELLVVISIIAVLVAMLLPSLGEARHATKMALCSGNQRQIALAVVNYAIGHRGRLPATVTHHNGASGTFSFPHLGAYNSATTFASAPDHWKPGANRQLRTYLLAYLPEGRSLSCPLGPSPASTIHREYLNPPSWAFTSFAMVWGVSYPGTPAFVGPQTLDDEANSLLTLDTVLYHGGTIIPVGTYTGHLPGRSTVSSATWQSLWGMPGVAMSSGALSPIRLNVTRLDGSSVNTPFTEFRFTTVQVNSYYYAFPTKDFK